MSSTARGTFLDSVAESVGSVAVYNRNDMVAPLAVLWPDGGCEWSDVVPGVRERIPVLTVGTYDPEKLTGPAIWIRCMLTRTLPEADWPDDVTPVVYLPGYSRSELRAVEECPEEIKPLAELQYRGTIWSQKSNRDWTLAAFLQAPAGGLGIPIASDSATLEALRRAAVVLLDEPVARLRANAPLKADFFNELLTPDITRQVLLWMDDPDKEKQRLSSAEWAAFRDQCRRELSLDPERDGEVTAAEKLGLGQAKWAQVWQRFKESPKSYSKIPDLLRRAKPQPQMTLFDKTSKESWPQDNEYEEELLRMGLIELAKKSPAEARDEIARLEREHGHRRSWVWAELGKSPLGTALQHLAKLSDLSAQPFGGGSVQDIAGRYFEEGWRVDSAALCAVACVREGKDLEAVSAVLDALYRPWLVHCCETFQAAWASSPPEIEKSSREPENGVVYVFADGLRMDLARGLTERLSQNGFESGISYRFAPLPSITETAKPAASPVAEELSGGSELSLVTGEGTKVDAEVLRTLLQEHGFAVLGPDETGDPTGSAWTECGRLDEIGHIEGWRLAYRAEDELQQLVQRVKELLDAGWREARIVTDHGWLLLPGKLPAHSLPQVTTEIRKGRCARLKPEAKVDCQTVPWYWHPEVRIAVAPGIKCFISGKDYEHGGISPQEIVVPDISVKSAEAKPEITFEEAKWVGLRCKVQLGGSFAGLSVDLRTRPGDPGSSVAESPKQVDQEGGASLVCGDDSLESAAAVLVVYASDRPERVLAQIATVIGGSDG